VARRLVRLTLLAAALAVPLVGYGFSSGAYGGFCGAPGEDTCRHCHDSFPLNVGGGSLAIDGFPDAYTPGETYHVTITLTSPSARDWGFQTTVLTERGHMRVGKFILTDREHTKVVPGIFMTTRLYVEQKSAGHYDGQTGSASWTFDWRAPAKDKGAITIYACGNAGNDNDKPTGDFIYSVQKTAQPPG
jgi:Reeler domain-containing protein